MKTKQRSVTDRVLGAWHTKKQFADELGVTVGNLNQILIRGPENEEFPHPGFSCQKLGKENRYNPEYVAVVKNARRVKSARPNKSALKRAALVITIPIFDPNAAAFLRKKFKDDAGVTEFVRQKIDEACKPALEKIRKIEDEYQKRISEALGG